MDFKDKNYDLYKKHINKLNDYYKDRILNLNSYLNDVKIDLKNDETFLLLFQNKNTLQFLEECSDEFYESKFKNLHSNELEDLTKENNILIIELNKLKNILKIKEEDSSNYIKIKNDNKDLKFEIEKILYEKDNLKQINSDLKDDIEEREINSLKDIKCIKEELEKYKKITDETNEKLNEKENIMNDLKDQIKYLNNDKLELTNFKELSNKKIEELKNKVENLNDCINNYKFKLENKEIEINKYNQEIDHLSKLNKKLEGNIVDLSWNNNICLDENNTKFNKDIKDKNNQINQLEISLKELKSDYSNENNLKIIKINDLNNIIDEKLNNINFLNLELNKISELLKSANEGLKIKDNSIFELERSLKENNDKLIHLSQIKKKLEKENFNLQLGTNIANEHNSSINIQKDNHNIEINILKNELKLEKDNTIKIEKLSTQIKEQCTLELNNLKNKYEDVLNENKQLNIQINELYSNLTNIEKDNEINTTYKNELEFENLNLKQENEKFQNSLEKLVNDKKKLISEYNQLLEKYEYNINLKKNEDEERKIFDKLLDDEKNKNYNLHSENQQILKQMDKYKINSLKNSEINNKKEIIVSELNNKINDLSKNNAELYKENLEMNSKKSEFETEILNLKNKHLDLENKLKIDKNNNENIVGDLEINIKNLNEKNQELYKMIETKSNIINDKSKFINNLFNRVNCFKLSITSKFSYIIKKLAYFKDTKSNYIINKNSIYEEFNKKLNFKKFLTKFSKKYEKILETKYFKLIENLNSKFNSFKNELDNNNLKLNEEILNYKNILIHENKVKKELENKIQQLESILNLKDINIKELEYKLKESSKEIIFKSNYIKEQEKTNDINYIKYQESKDTYYNSKLGSIKEYYNKSTKSLMDEIAIVESNYTKIITDLKEKIAIQISNIQKKDIHNNLLVSDLQNNIKKLESNNKKLSRNLNKIDKEKLVLKKKCITLVEDYEGKIKNLLYIIKKEKDRVNYKENEILEKKFYIKNFEDYVMDLE